MKPRACRCVATKVKGEVVRNNVSFSEKLKFGIKDVLSSEDYEGISN